MTRAALPMKSSLRPTSLRMICLTILLLFTAAPAAHGAGKPLAAVWAGDASLQDLSALSQAMLSDAGDVQLVERQDVQKVLDEQTLSLTGLVDADHAVVVGGLLSCDLCVILEGDQQDAAVVVFDAHSGVRLCDRAVGVKGGQTSVPGDVVTAVRDALAKRTAGAGTHVLCVQEVRNADLPHEMDSLCKGASRLVQQRLLESKEICMLERARLDHINEEHRLTGASSVLMVSPVLIQLQVARGKGDGLTMTAVLTDTAGKMIATVSADAAKGATGDMVDDIVPKILQAIRVTVPPPLKPTDRVAEADRFGLEVKNRWEHGETADALEAAEAAYAVLPNDHLIKAVLARALAVQSVSLCCGGSFASPVRPLNIFLYPSTRTPRQYADSMRLASRAMSVIEEAGVQPTQDWPLRAIAESSSEIAMDREMIIRNTLNLLSQYLLHLHTTLNSTNGHPPMLILSDEERGLYEQFTRDFRHYRVETEEPVARSLVHDSQSLVRYNIYLSDVLGELRCVATIKPEEWTTQWQTLVEQWVPLAQKYALATPDHEATPMALTEWVVPFPSTRWTPDLFGFDPSMTEADWQRMSTTFRAMEQVSDPHIREIGQLGALYADEQTQRLQIPRPRMLPQEATQARQLVPAPTPRTKPLVGPGTNWPDSLLLMDAGDPQNGITEIGLPCLDPQRKFVYALAESHQGKTGIAQLVRFDLSSGEKTALGSCTSDEFPYPYPNIPNVISSITNFYQSGGSAFLTPKYYVVCDMQTGVYLFPLDGGKVKRIDAKSANLPASTYQAAAILDDTLYLAIGQPLHDGFLIAYSLKDGTYKTLASGQRVGGALVSPFDNSAPLFIWAMYPDPTRHRIVFLAANKAWVNHTSGWWSFEPGTNSYKELCACLVPYDPPNRTFVWSTLFADQITFGLQPPGAYSIDLNTDQTSPLPRSPFCPGLDIAHQPTPADIALAGPYVQVGGWIWGRFGRFRAPKDIGKTPAPPADPATLQGFKPISYDTTRWGMWPLYYQMVDADHIVIGDEHALFYLHIPTHDGAAMAKVLFPPKTQWAFIQGDSGPPAGGELPYDSVDTIFDVNSQPDDALFTLQPILRGNDFYCIAVAKSDRPTTTAQLRHYSLVDRSEKTLATTTLQIRQQPSDTPSYNLLSSIDDQWYYLADLSSGQIHAFALDGSAQKSLEIPNVGSTRAKIVGLAAMGAGKLLVARDIFQRQAKDDPLDIFSMPAFDCIDVASGHVTSVAIPGVTDVRAGDAAGDVVRARFVQSDAARHRAIFLLGALSANPDIDGLYAINADGAVERILPIDYLRDFDLAYGDGGWRFGWCNPVQNDQFLLGQGDRCYLIDLTEKSFRCVYSTKSYFEPVGGRMMVDGDWVYHALYFGRLRIEGTGLESFPAIRTAQGHDTPQVLSLMQLAADGHEIVIADDRALWVLHMR